MVALIAGAKNTETQLSHSDIGSIVNETMQQFPDARRVLIVHTDYSRHDATGRIVRPIQDILIDHGVRNNRFS